MGTGRSGARARLAAGRWEPSEAGLAAGAVLSSRGPAETASVATANDEYHMLGSCCYKISYATTA